MFFSVLTTSPIFLLLMKSICIYEKENIVLKVVKKKNFSAVKMAISMKNLI